MAVVYYGLGGGHGHGVRGVAVLRAMARVAGGETPAVHLLAPSRLRPWVESERLQLHVPPEPEPSRRRLGAWCRQILEELQPALLLVDTFPRGVLGELLELPCPAWLMARNVPCRYYLADEIRVAIESRFERLVWCEGPPEWADRLHLSQSVVNPVLIRRPEECLPRREARERLMAATDRKLVLVLASGPAPRQVELVRLMARLRVVLRSRLYRSFDVVVLSDELGAFAAAGVRVGAAVPAMEVLRAADVVVSAGGYHATWEARAVGVPAVWLPQSRLLDDQLERCRCGRVASCPEELCDALAEILANRVAPATSVLCDGADAVAREVVSRVQSPATDARAGGPPS